MFLMFQRIRNKKALHTVHYALLITVVVSVLLAMLVYMKRGKQGQLRNDADKIGKAYAPAVTTSETSTIHRKHQEEIMDAGYGLVNEDEYIYISRRERIPGYEQEIWWGTSPAPEAGVAPSPQDSSPGDGVPPLPRPPVPGDIVSPQPVTGETGGGTGTGSGGGGGGGGGGGSGSGGSGSGGGSTPGGPSGGGDTPGYIYNSDIASALSLLQSSPTGAYYYNLIQDNAIPVFFYDFALISPEYDQQVGAFYVPAWDMIFVNQNLQQRFPNEAIAAVIAHEAVHADYDYNPQKWIDITMAAHPELSAGDIHIPGNSIDQEYNAHVTQVQVWKEIRGSQSEPIHDGLVEIFDQGEAFAKAYIRRVYADQDLPEY